jgi:hypothetical protein
VAHLWCNLPQRFNTEHKVSVTAAWKEDGDSDTIKVNAKMQTGAQFLKNNAATSRRLLRQKW